MKSKIKELEVALRAIVEGQADAIIPGEQNGASARANLPYRILLDTISEGAVAISPDADILYANPALCILFGQTTLQEFIGKKLFDIFPKQCTDVLRGLMVSASNQNISAEFEYLNKSGQLQLVRLSLSPVIKNGISLGFVALIVDITEYRIVDPSEYKKTIEQLEGERFRLAQAQRVAKIGSWETDIASLSVKWSDETHRIFGTDPSTFHPTHQGFIELVHPDDRMRVDEAFVSSLNQKDEGVIEHHLRMSDGRIKFIEERWQVLHNEQATPIQVFGTCQDITERKIAEERIEQLAWYDSLTDLPNRRLLLDRLQNIHAISSRHPDYDAVLFIDLDNFKNLNATKGHNIGDLLLIEIANRLRLCLRKSDTIGRLGGDEFIVILQGLNEDIQKAAAITEKVGKKILHAISQPFAFNGQLYFGSASIGVSLFCNQEITIDELLKRADTAMYQAKNAGRNTLRFYDPGMQASLEARRTLENDLRTAVNEGQFKLYFQIQVNHSGRILGAEVLIRWHHPEIGLIPPMQFIPLAEETGLILAIGQWVIDTACAQIKKWEKDPLTRDLKISVNVSARQFHQPEFVEQVLQAIQNNEIDPLKLKLELTETLVLNNIDETIAKMDALKKIGLYFSLDDFGTGYSSLSYLTKLPLDELKIDQSFVRNISTHHKDAVIVQTIIGMAKNLGIEVIAEGVETETQRAFLEKHGCNVCQGYLFGKPMPIEEFEVRVKSKEPE